jgi:hypothetical protein
MIKSVVSAFVISLVFAGSVLAECWVDQGALCSAQKNNLVLLIMAMERKDEVRVAQLVKGGRIKPCKKAKTKVMRKEKMRDQGMLYADVAGVGKLWVREQNVHCD